jgi:hypothetical protein
MPEEAVALEKLPPPFIRCIYCAGQIRGGAWHEPCTLWMRGQVRRSKRSWWPPFRKRPYCAVICPHCRRHLGWEDLEGNYEDVHRDERAIYDTSNLWPDD